MRWVDSEGSQHREQLILEDFVDVLPIRFVEVFESFDGDALGVQGRNQLFGEQAVDTSLEIGDPFVDGLDLLIG